MRKSVNVHVNHAVATALFDTRRLRSKGQGMNRTTRNRCERTWHVGLLLTLWPALALAQERPWPDYVGCDVVPYATSAITHGPMLGRPGATSIRVWVRTAKPAPFRVVYAKDVPLTAESPGVDGKTLADADNTGVVDLTDLEPDTRYTYGVVLDGTLVDTRIKPRGAFPWFRTLPATDTHRNASHNPKGLFNLCFSVGVGANQHPHRGGGHHVNPPAFATLWERHGGDVQFHIMNGDFIYEEHRTKAMDSFRQDYKLYLSRGRTMANFMRHVPSFFTFDDHETYSDMEGTGEIGLRKGKWLYLNKSLVPWYEYAGWANFTGPQHGKLRFGEAEVQHGGNVLHDPKADFSKLRPETVTTVHVDIKAKNAGVYRFVEVVDAHRLRVEPSFRADETCAYSIGTHHYFDWKVANCHLFVLDTRGERTRYVPDKAHDPDRFVLGEAQSEWLLDGVRKTDADFIFVVSSVAWTIYHTNFHVAKRPPTGRSPKEDGFPGYVVEREKLLNALDGVGKPVILLTGDLHNSFAVQITDNVWEFLTAPINSKCHPRATAGKPPFAGWFDSEGRQIKIKWMAGFPDDVHYSRLWSLYYTIVQVNNVFPSAKPKGTGVRWVAYDSPQVVVRFHDGYTGKLLYAEGISKVDLEPKPVPSR